MRSIHLTHKEQPLTHKEQHPTYNEHAHIVHETDSFTNENSAGWQYEYLASNSFMVHKVGYNIKSAIPLNVYWNLIPDINIFVVFLFTATILSCRHTQKLKGP